MLKVDQNEISLGDLEANKVKEFTFNVYNDSDNSVSVILNVSCGCTVPKISPNPIPANTNAIVYATFDTTGKSGFQKKSIYIEYMQENDKLKLTVPFKANVLNG